MADVDFASLVPVSQEVKIYVLEWHGEAELDGHLEVAALVVMKREAGMLLALPLNVVPEEDLVPTEDGAIGPSTQFEIEGLVQDGGNISPIGRRLNVLVVDVDASLAISMREANGVEELLNHFSADDPFAYPDPGELVARTMAWLQDTQALLQNAPVAQRLLLQEMVCRPRQRGSQQRL